MTSSFNERFGSYFGNFFPSSGEGYDSRLELFNLGVLDDSADTVTQTDLREGVKSLQKPGPILLRPNESLSSNWFKRSPENPIISPYVIKSLQVAIQTDAPGVFKLETADDIENPDDIDILLNTDFLGDSSFAETVEAVITKGFYRYSYINGVESQGLFVMTFKTKYE